MDFREKAKIRLERWIDHNDHHEEEYLAFAEELESAGMEQSGSHVREMVSMAAKGTESLRKALQALS